MNKHRVRKNKDKRLLFSCVAVCVLAILASILVLSFLSRPKPPSPEPPPYDGTVSLDYPPLPSETVASPDAVPSPLPPLTKLTWEATVVSDTHVLEEETLCLYAASRPLLFGGIEEATARINKTLEQYCDDFIFISDFDKLLAEESYQNTLRDGKEFVTRERSSDFTAYLHENVLSVLFSETRIEGGATDNLRYVTLHFDVYTGEEITFAQFINRSDEAATTYILSLFTQWISGAPGRFYPDAADVIRYQPLLRSFYLTEEGVVLYVNGGQISPGAYGIQTLTVPYDKLS